MKLSEREWTVLNALWETLKVDSAAFGGEIYIICAVIAVLLIAFFVYLYIIRRKRRKLYWTPQAKQKN